MRSIVRWTGPYTYDNGRRKNVRVHYSDGTSETTSYARFQIETILGYELPRELQVDHIDGDPTNEDITNYQILSQRDNAQKSKREEEIFHFTCTMCGNPSTKKARNVRGNTKQGHSGPYCSRECARKHQLKSSGYVVGSHEHGTLNKYKTDKCRCEACRKANSNYVKRRKYACVSQGQRNGS